MKLIVGLGNPGEQYKETNHNVGFRVVDKLIKYYAGRETKKIDCDSKVVKIKLNGEEVLLVKPQTYMNNSGLAVKGLVKKYLVDVKNELVVIADDFDIQEGMVKIKTTSGSTTHNGIKSIKAELNTNEFIRIKVSIGAKPAFMDTADFVLSKVRNDKTYEAEEKAFLAVCDFLSGMDINKVMQEYNTLGK